MKNRVKKNGLHLGKIIISNLSKAQMQGIYGGGTIDLPTIFGGPTQRPPVKYTSARTCASGFEGGCGSTNC